MKRRLNTCASVALLYAAVCCAAPLEPARGVFVGATVDFNVYAPESFNATTEFAHAFVLVFSSFPPNYGDLETWRKSDPGCSVLLSSTAYEGGSSMRLYCNGTGTNHTPTVAMREYALHDTQWQACDNIALQARVPDGCSGATLELVLQSDVTGWDARGPPHGDDNVTRNHSDDNVTQW